MKHTLMRDSSPGTKEQRIKQLRKWHAAPTITKRTAGCHTQPSLGLVGTRKWRYVLHLLVQRLVVHWPVVNADLVLAGL